MAGKPQRSPGQLDGWGLLGSLLGGVGELVAPYGLEQLPALSQVADCSRVPAFVHVH